MHNTVKTLVIRFGNELYQDEVECFRGAVLHVTEGADVLFHNHLEGDKLRYDYPLIQYKRIHRKAAIVCVGEGTEAIGEFFASCCFDVRIGERPVTLEVERVQAHQTLVQVWDDMFTYRIRKWLPLNGENYEKYMQTDSLAEKYALLENLLTGNILSMAKGLGIRFEKQVVCRITAIDDPCTVMYKGVKLMSFDAEFKTNVSIPDFVGLGKGVSLGCGTVVRRNDVSSPEKVFLLGGHDLEMETVKQIVDRCPDCTTVDLNLSWGNALLSRYLGVFNLYPSSEFYAVELQEDTELPVSLRSRYHRIDHHNDYAHKTSTLEQVAEVLGVKLDRFQKLVAANDSGYIPAMKALGATDEEISDIRLRDRAAQGVTEEDERLAEESIANNLQKGKRLWVVKSLTSKFSPICDRLYPYQSLLIYTDSEWMFYGEGKSELVECMAEDVRLGKVFHGGVENGYVGCVDGAYSQEEIEQFVNQIKERYDA